MIDYYTCNSFKQKFEVKENFSLYQKQLTLAGRLKLKPTNVKYDCEWLPCEIDSEKPFVAIPIRNCSALLRYTLENFLKNDMFSEANVIIIDDRSQENLKAITKNYPVSYLRVSNEYGFNFSMLNNIAALLSYKLGGSTFVLWNSDLWIDKIEYFQQLLSLHKDSDSTISGSKLLYPIESLHEEEHSDNIKNHFPDKLDGSYKDKVQFGGCRWVPTKMETTMGPVHCFVPHHFKRFSEKTEPRVNSNYATEFVTGALQVINLDWYITNGGLNPSIPKNYQDVDLCLRAVKDNKKVMYFGKDIHFYHDESYTFYTNKDEKKMDNQIVADGALFVKLWADHIPAIVF